MDQTEWNNCEAIHIK